MGANTMQPTNTRFPVQMGCQAFRMTGDEEGVQVRVEGTGRPVKGDAH
jgi:hypothetical protein